MESTRCRRRRLGHSRAAFGISDDIAPDQFLVGLAALTLVTTAAQTRRPLLIVVDDTQWLDQESADALGFLARRLYADRVCVLASMRDPIDGAQSARRVCRHSTSVRSRRRRRWSCLATAVHGPLADHVRARLLAEARGNPLALVEFGRELSPDQLAGADHLPEPLAIDRRLEGHFLRQVDALPPPTQRFLLVAAAEPTGDAGSIWRAGHELDFDEHAMAAAQSRRAARGRAADRVPPSAHPLGRLPRRQSRRSASGPRGIGRRERRQRDPDRRAWHRAAAAQFPDDEVAAELEDAARRARSRGSCAASAALLVRAAELTLDDEQRASRLLRAAAADLTAGSPVRAQGEPGACAPGHPRPAAAGPSPAARGHDRVPRLASWVAHERGNKGADGQDRLDDARAARAFEPLDVRLARDAVFDAIQMAVYFGESSAVSAVEVARVARSFELPAGTAPSAADLVLDAIAELIAEGYSAGRTDASRGARAVQREPRLPPFPVISPERVGSRSRSAMTTRRATLGTACAATSREHGAFRVLPEGLDYLGLRELRVGSLNLAEDLFTEVIGMRGGAASPDRPGRAVPG